MSCYNICHYSQNNTAFLMNRNEALMMQKVKQTKTSLIRASKKTSKISDMKMQQQSTKIKRKGHNQTQQSINTTFKLNFIDSRISQGYRNTYQSQMVKSKKSLSDFKKHNKNLSIQSCQSQYQQIQSQNQYQSNKFEKTENSTFHQSLPIGYSLNHTQQISIPLNNTININHPPFRQSYHSSNDQTYYKPISSTQSQNNKFNFEVNYSLCKKSQICQQTSVGLKQSSKLSPIPSPIPSPILYYKNSQCKSNTNSIIIANFDQDSAHFLKNNNNIFRENTSKSIILRPSQQIRCQQQRKKETHQRRITQNQQLNNNFFNEGVETVQSGWGSSQNYSSLVESNVIYHLKTNGSNFGEESVLRQNSRHFYFEKKSGFNTHKPQQIKIQSKQIEQGSLSFSLNLENTLKGTSKFLQSEKDKDPSILLTGYNNQLLGENYTAIINKINFICRIKKIHLSKLKNLNITKYIQVYPIINHKNLIDIYYLQKTKQKLLIISEYGIQDLKTIMAKNGGTIQQKYAKKYIKNIIQGLIYLEENNINITLDINSIKIINGSLKIEWLNLDSLTQLNIGQRSIKKNIYIIGLISYLMVFGKSPQQTDIVTFKSLKQITSYPNISEKYRNFLQNILIYDERYQPTLYQCLLHPLFY